MYQGLTRLINATGSGFSYLASLVSGKPVVSGMPLSVSVELTNACNLRCPECITGSGKLKRASGYMNTDLFEKIINELRPYLYNINLYFQGEPMLHPEFFSFIGKCRGLTSLVSTNGHFLTEENCIRLAHSGLGTLVISLDGLDPESYSSYRVNGDLAMVIKGIETISSVVKEGSSSLKVIVQFLVNKKNEQQLDEVRKFTDRAGVLLRLKSMQIISPGGFEAWLPSVKKFSRYSSDGNRYRLKSSLPDRCMRPWFNPVVTWDGKVLPCCFDKDADHIVGDVNKDTFEKIWKSCAYNDFRRSVLNGRRNVEICRNCTSGLKGVSGEL
jgi:radical SAM protein with 4Fe4S-binding SPASM domain